MEKLEWRNIGEWVGLVNPNQDPRFSSRGFWRYKGSKNFQDEFWFAI